MHSFTTATFSSILSVGILIASGLSTLSELSRRALPVGVSVSTAKTYLSQRECLHSRFLGPSLNVISFIVAAEPGRNVRNVRMCPHRHLSTPVPRNLWDLINNDPDGAAPAVYG